MSDRQRMLLLLGVVLALSGCDRPPPRPPAVDSLPDTATVDSDDTIDTDLYHVAPNDTLLPGQTVAPPKPVPLAGLRMAASTSGLPVGPTLYLPDDWCDGFISGTVLSGQPDRILGTLKKADACNMRVALTIPRMWLTANGQQTGDFSPSRARSSVDQIAAALAKVPAAHRDNLLYISALDDMACTHCWGGHAVTKDQTAAHTKYARSKFPSWVAVGLRVDPGWMLGRSDWGVDVTTAQWHERKGPKNLSGVPRQKAWYESVKAAAPRVGVKRIVYTVNVHDCGGMSTPACTPGELKEYGAVALAFDPEHNCGFLAWRYEGVYFQQNAYQDAWRYLVNLGKQRPTVTCKG